jgi:hypothetical protein
MEDFGWNFRPSNHGVVGRAPDGKTTAAIGRSAASGNRSFQNSAAVLKRWIRTNRPDVLDVASDYVHKQQAADDETNPITAEILHRRATRQTIEKVEELVSPAVADRLRRSAGGADPTIEHEIVPQAQTTEEEIDMSKPMITETRPWTAKGSKDNIQRVIERVWSTGRRDYQCASEGCSVCSNSPRSITQHFGSAHTTRHLPRVPKEPMASGVVAYEVVDDFVDDAVADEGISTKRMVDAGSNGSSVPDPDAVIAAIRSLVSQPLLDQVEILTKERDEAREHLAKIQQDLDALRSLVAGIGNL